MVPPLPSSLKLPPKSNAETPASHRGILGMMSRLSTDDRTEEEMKVLKQILGLLSLQVLSEETNDCKEAGKISLATATSTKKPPTKRARWNLLKCTYMMVTFLFVSYNKGDWCYCHSCSTAVDIRYVTARRAFSPPSPW
ncbi:epididymal protein 13 isoform X2 [Leopardus geoffroyi]|uniref:epididymal protein 13 isoform X2 n=1 Tax=Leopardus geoffroyi TaxID=46844 RepID=UPI001E261388|nr:epididymal protein 13 isoform X2 [Leopardus geoffroyi]